MTIWLAMTAAVAAFTPAAAQTPRPQVAVTLLALDNVRKYQLEHGQAALDTVGEPGRGRFVFVEGGLTDQLSSCEDEDRRLDYCVRYYLTRAERAADAPPMVVVAFDDRREEEEDRFSARMRVRCFGRGVAPADAAAQDTWLWPASARMHGVSDWDRDLDALAGCIAAAASEPWTGLREPDLD
jgi:hypothetical protein